MSYSIITYKSNFKDWALDKMEDSFFIFSAALETPCCFRKKTFIRTNNQKNSLIIRIDQ